MVVKIRVFNDNDYWQIETLVRSFMDNDPFSPPIIVRQMQDLFGDFFLIAYDPDISNSEILGYIMGGVIFNNSNIGWILEIYVKEGFRNKGIGNDLVHTMIKKLRSAGVKEIRLTVDPKNTSALKTYLRNGFVIEAVINEHYRKGKKVYLMKNRT